MSAASRLRSLLAQPRLHVMPCCGDALGAKLIEQAGFPVGFVSGFSVAATHGLPDTGLLSYSEMEVPPARPWCRHMILMHGGPHATGRPFRPPDDSTPCVGSPSRSTASRS